MTEFAQKINYQRALQGEITRTILSFDEVKDVRVHLALPEEGLFKRATSKTESSHYDRAETRSSLVYVLNRCRAFNALWLPLFPELWRPDVVVSDQHGIILSRSEEQSEIGQSHSALELKKKWSRH